jgi:hypothetical protein
MSEGRVPSKCPSCGASMLVARLECPICETEVTGEFDLCPVCRLEGAFRKLLELFLDAHGNLREVQKRLQVSYPTARHRIEQMFGELEQGPPRPDPKVVLKRVEMGDLDVNTAIDLLSGQDAK